MAGGRFPRAKIGTEGVSVTGQQVAITRLRASYPVRTWKGRITGFG